jgi:hypothetical protein
MGPGIYVRIRGTQTEEGHIIAQITIVNATDKAMVVAVGNEEDDGCESPVDLQWHITTRAHDEETRSLLLPEDNKDEWNELVVGRISSVQPLLFVVRAGDISGKTVPTGRGRITRVCRIPLSSGRMADETIVKLFYRLRFWYVNEIPDGCPVVGVELKSKGKGYCTVKPIAGQSPNAEGR